MKIWASALLIALIVAEGTACALSPAGRIEVNQTASIALPRLEAEGLDVSPFDLRSLSVCRGDAGIEGRLCIPGEDFAEICASKISLSDLFSLNLSLEGLLSNRIGNVSLNSSGWGSFILPALPRGGYMLCAVSNGTLAAAVMVFIADEGASLDTPSNITAGDMVKVGLRAPENSTGYFGAALVSMEEYGKFSVKAIRNDSSSRVLISNGASEVAVPAGMSISAMADLYALIPQDSALAVQELSGSSTEAFLLTDPDWKPGKYVLTCMAYTRERGMIGIWQIPVDVL